MSFTDNVPRFAGCRNVENCGIARAGNGVEWYPGAGEYCPECGEALVLRDPVEAVATPQSPTPPSAFPSVADPDAGARVPSRPQRRAPARSAQRSGLIWAIVALLAAVTAGYVIVRVWSAGFKPASLISVCTAPIAQTLSADLVRAYAQKSGTPQTQFEIVDQRDCDIRFSTAAASPQDVIASDGLVAIVNPLNGIGRISEDQLRAVFNGSIKDWSQLGQPASPIIPILPDAGTDEAKALALYGFSIAPNVLRGGSSADVARSVSGADRRSHDAIGLVAFSSAVPAKVVPLSYLPAPSVISIASHQYPFTLTIAVDSDTGRADPATTGLLDFVRSSDGAAVVEQNGFVPRESP